MFTSIESFDCSCVGIMWRYSVWEWKFHGEIWLLFLYSFFGSKEASLFCKSKQICNFYHFMYHLNDPLLEFCVVTLYGYYACVLCVGTLYGYSVWVLCVGTLWRYSVWEFCVELSMWISCVGFCLMFLQASC